MMVLSAEIEAYVVYQRNQIREMEGLIEDYAAYFVSHSASSVLTSQNRPPIARFFL